LRYAHRNNDDRLKATGASLAARRATTAVRKAGNVISLRHRERHV